MKKLLSQSPHRHVAVLCAAMLLAAVLAGCQTGGKVVSASDSSVCPTCKTETRTMPIKGLTYKKHVCPGCKTVTEIDHYTGNVTTVHVCDRCKAAVSLCPQCVGK